MSFPAIYYACPCTDIASDPLLAFTNAEAESTTGEEIRVAGSEQSKPQDSEGNQREDAPFNPHTSRASFALYPLEHLLFCTECHELRCPRCYYEEVLNYYCPSCLHERTSTSVKSESNRCPQSCHQCPVCSTTLAVSRYSDVQEALTDKKASSGPYLLSCPYCYWSTLEVGILFEHRVNISGQLAEVLRQRSQKLGDGIDLSPSKATAQEQFGHLVDFYRSQTAEANPGRISSYATSPGPNSQMLRTRNFSGLRRQSKPAALQREASKHTEGFYAIALHDDDTSILTSMAELGWQSTTSIQQRDQQIFDLIQVKHMLPTSTPLRSRRVKRCRMCKHSLVRPADSRSTSGSTSSSSSRYRIKLVAKNYIPRIGVTPLTTSTSSTQSIKLVASQTQPMTAVLLQPARTLHYLLTFRNPLFSRIKVTLATPRLTPGLVASRVTILCPSFDVAPNKDIWDDNLSMASTSRKPASTVNDLSQQTPEAGKVWAAERNATTVVVEVVPGELPKRSTTAGSSFAMEGVEDAVSLLGKDSVINPEVLSIPIFVRLEYESPGISDGVGVSSTSVPSVSVTGPPPTSATFEDFLHTAPHIAGSTDEKSKKELAYWCVIELGRITV